MVAIVALAANFLHGLPAARADDGKGRPKVTDNETAVAGHAQPVKPRRKEPLLETGRESPKVTWPEAGSAKVDVPAANEPPARAGDLSVWATAPAKPSPQRAAKVQPAGEVKVQILDRAAAKRAGVNGLLLSVARADDADVAGRVGLRVDYSGIASAFGGDYGARLRLKRLPACVLTTPHRPACRTAIEVTTVNDREAETLSADVDAAPLSASAATAAAGETVPAASAAPSGPKGDYKATSLSASATWQVSAQSGAFSWSYPMRTPPVPGDLQPDVSISYSSSAIDGRTSSTNNQSSWLGEGMELWPGYIERRYKSCGDDGAPKDEFGNEPSDSCWAYDNATVTWNGHGGELIKAADGTWRLKDDDGTRFERLTDAGKGNGDNDGEYWKVTTTDGTQYYFGLNRLPTWASGKTETKSTWTSPVFGDDSGEPCHDTTFAGSWCQQAYRWNLDYVVDPHDNAMSYWYTPETNYYGRNLKAADETPYERGGWLDHIEYGQRSSTIFSAKAPARVNFATSERCLPDAAFDCDPAKIADKPEAWPDVPWDLHCNSGQECKDDHGTLAPTFWSRKRLTKVTTQVIKADSTYRDVDSWTMDHAWGNADIDRSLLLASIQHTGHTGTAPEPVSISLPKVTFNYKQLANRLDEQGDDIAPFIKYRLSAIFDESGGQTNVAYSDPDCSLDTLPTPQTNTRRCYPTYWTPGGYEDPIRDWFHKYVVTEVTKTDLTGWSPDMITRYSYLGGGAWHFNDDDGLTKEKEKTWSDWRGYGQVRVQSGGTEGMQSQTDHFYLRGMDGDRETTSGGEKDVTVSDGEGGDHVDHGAQQGFQLKTVNYDGPGGAVVDKTVNTPWHHQTASRTRSWGTTTANLTGTASTHTWTALGNDKWRETHSETTHENVAGLATQVNDKGDISTAADDRCIRTSYATNAAAWMRSFVSRIETVAVGCATTPDRSKQVISDVVSYYDKGAFDAAPTKGDVTKTEKIAAHDGATARYVIQSTSVYDAFGRVTSSTDAAGNTSTTAFVETAGLTTKSTATTPQVVAGNTSTALVTQTILDPARGQPTLEADPNLKRTEMTYDALGRTLKVWLPNTRKGSTNPNYAFSYRTIEGKIVAVATTTLAGDDDGQETSYQLYDGWLRPRQTQEPGPNSGRLIADTFYDSRGLVARTYDTYYASGAPESALFGVETPGAVDTQIAYGYDGLGRKTVERLVPGSGGVDEKWRTTTTYAGDRVSVDPPAGGTPSTTVTNARGQTTEVRQYTGDGPTGDYDASTYSYTPAGQLDTLTDAAGNKWVHHYDLRGRETSTDDPDKGTTSSTYNDLDQVTSTTDARGKKLFFSYDPLGRKTEQREGSATGTMLASWTYDTLYKGQLTKSTRNAGGAVYTDTIGDYDGLYRPKRHTVTVPSVPGEESLAGNYQFNTSYNRDGTVQGEDFPQSGGMDTEAIAYAYDELGRPLTTSGYVTDTEYTETGKPKMYELSTGGKKAWLTYGYEDATQRLAESRLDREDIPGVDRDAKYRYDEAGNVTKISDVSASGTDTQCFTHDYLRRLTDAWTQNTTDCSATPVRDVIGGPAPYWHSYAYDKAGNRTSETQYGIGGAADTNRTYTYPEAGQPRPHAVTQVNQSGGAGVRTDGFSYDESGNTTGRSMGAAAQTLEWDAEGELTKVTNGNNFTSYLYDADGERVLRRDNGGTTLYLDGGRLELRMNKATKQVTGTRYYTAGADGPTIAARTTAGVTFLVPDAQGTDQIAVNATTQAITQRRLTPFGQPRGQTPGSWPTDRGFVGGTQDPTGYTHLGAREYDPTTGSFLSVDPIFTLDDPQSWNGYGYASGSPVTYSDPDGLTRCDAGVCPTPGQNVHGGNYCATHNCNKPKNPYNGPPWEDPDNNPFSGWKSPYDRDNYLAYNDFLAANRALAKALSDARAAKRIEYQHEVQRAIDATRPWYQKTWNHIKDNWKAYAKDAAGWLSDASLVAGLIPFCGPCQAISVATGAFSAGLYAATGDFGTAGRQLASTAVGVVVGGTGMGAIRTFGKFGKMHKHLTSPSRLRRAYGQGRVALNHGGAGGAFQKAARRAGRGKLYRAYWGIKAQYAGVGAGELITG